jgi:MoaA/NifB/PqqE/SkfB family radical SAM enzyme
MCCVATEAAGNLNKHTIEQIWNSKHYREARLKMLRGEKVSACTKCYDEEAGSVLSHRLIQNHLWEEKESDNEGHVGEEFMNDLISQTTDDGYLKPPPISLDLRLGNTCNLQCIMCGPKDSSKWVGFAKQLGQIDKWDTSKFNWVDNQDFWSKQFLPLLPNIQHLILAGGEPMYLKQHIELLEKIVEQGHADHIKIRYHTNATITPSNKIFKLWKEFKYIDLCMSIDCYEEKNSYIRHPDLWNDILDTLHMVDCAPDNIGPRINCTINAINVFYMPEYIKWIENQKFKKVSKQGTTFQGLPFVGYVHGPTYLNCKVLPEHMKQAIVDKYDDWYKQYKNKWFGLDRIYGIRNFMLEEDKSKHFDEFKGYINKIDSIRGTSFKQTFPEFAALMEK